VRSVQSQSHDKVVLEAVTERCCGLDVHQKTVVACLLIGLLDQQPTESIRTFSATIMGLMELRDWLVQNGCSQVAIESTGIYWRPVFHVLEDSVNVLLANAYHLRQVPGRKTDLKDAQWIARLLRWGLLRPSLIPPKHIRELRELCRYRKKLTEHSAAEKNRIQKVLEDANIKLASVMSDVFGVSGRAMLASLIEGKLSPSQTAGLARGSLRKKTGLLTEALGGHLTEHHRFLINKQLEHLDYLEEDIARLNQAIAEKSKPYLREINLMCSTPGIDTMSAQHILAELGGDIRLFPSAVHLASWAGICPGNNESAGKRRSGQSAKGNPWLKTLLVQCAHAASRTKGTYLKAFYNRLAARRGKKRAAIAVAHKQLTIIYHELSEGVPYRELGEDFFDHLNEKSLQKRLVRRLEGLGFHVDLTLESAGQAS
jgi:transposase